MPKLTEDGFYDGVVKSAKFNLEYKSFEVCVETEDGKHAYPNLYLENKGGGQNTEAFDKLQEVFGWSGNDADELITGAVGKKIRFSVKNKGEKTYYNFVTPKKEQKPAPESKDVNSWLSGLRGKATDLSIDESKIPF